MLDRQASDAARQFGELFPEVYLRFHRRDGKRSELAKFLLDCLQTFMPLAVSDLSIGLIPAFSPILLVQSLNLSNRHTGRPLCDPVLKSGQRGLSLKGHGNAPAVRCRRDGCRRPALRLAPREPAGVGGKLDVAGGDPYQLRHHRLLGRPLRVGARPRDLP